MNLIKIINFSKDLVIFLFCTCLSSHGSPLIMIGHPEILEHVRATQVRDVTDEGKRYVSQESDHFFIRDLFIQRPDGKILMPSIPNRIHSPLKVVSLLPYQEKEQILDGEGYGAFGLRYDSQKLASSLVEAYHLSVHHSRSALEGGNVFVQGDRAIVGINSVALTMLLNVLSH